MENIVSKELERLWKIYHNLKLSRDVIKAHWSSGSWTSRCLYYGGLSELELVIQGIKAELLKLHECKEGSITNKPTKESHYD